jgi:hypothetical protein
VRVARSYAAPGGHRLGMGKEILLMLAAKKAVFPPGWWPVFGVIPMHELKACEIPLWWRSSSA